MNKKLLLFSGLLVSLFVFSTALAADVIVPNKNNPDVNTGSGETHHNLYTAGSTVAINSATSGDLAAAGGTVTVNGKVDQDILIVGGTINLNESVGGDVRIVGGNVVVNNSVSGDLVAAGGTLNITDKSSVGGDLLAGAGTLNLYAPVSGQARIAGGSVYINSKINGDVYVQAGKELVFGPKAEVTGTVHYKGPKQAEVQQGAKVSNIQFTEVHKEGKRVGGLLTAAFFISLAAWLLLGFVLYWLFKGFPLLVAEETFRRPWENLGIGFIGLILIPILAILLLVVVVGYYIAILLVLGYVLLLALTGILSAIALGYLIIRYLFRQKEPTVFWQALLIGVVVWFLLRLIPVVGWIIMAIIFLMVFGQLLRMARNSYLPRRQS